MTEQSTPAPADDVEGHRIAAFIEGPDQDVDDVEGHRVGPKLLPGEEEDVEGHVNPRPPVSQP